MDAVNKKVEERKARKATFLRLCNFSSLLNCLFCDVWHLYDVFWIVSIGRLPAFLQAAQSQSDPQVDEDAYDDEEPGQDDDDDDCDMDVEIEGMDIPDNAGDAKPSVGVPPPDSQPLVPPDSQPIEFSPMNAPAENPPEATMDPPTGPLGWSTQYFYISALMSMHLHTFMHI